MEQNKLPPFNCFYNKRINQNLLPSIVTNSMIHIHKPEDNLSQSNNQITKVISGFKQLQQIPNEHSYNMPYSFFKEENPLENKTYFQGFSNQIQNISQPTFITKNPYHSTYQEKSQKKLLLQGNPSTVIQNSSKRKECDKKPTNSKNLHVEYKDVSENVSFQATGNSKNIKKYKGKIQPINENEAKIIETKLKNNPNLTITKKDISIKHIHPVYQSSLLQLHNKTIDNLKNENQIQKPDANIPFVNNSYLNKGMSRENCTVTQKFHQKCDDIDIQLLLPLDSEKLHNKKQINFDKMIETLQQENRSAFIKKTSETNKKSTCIGNETLVIPQKLPPPLMHEKQLLHLKSDISKDKNEMFKLVDNKSNVNGCNAKQVTSTEEFQSLFIKNCKKKPFQDTVEKTSSTNKISINNQSSPLSSIQIHKKQLFNTKHESLAANKPIIDNSNLEQNTSIKTPNSILTFQVDNNNTSKIKCTIKNQKYNTKIMKPQLIEGKSAVPKNSSKTNEQLAGNKKQEHPSISLSSIHIHQTVPMNVKNNVIEKNELLLLTNNKSDVDEFACHGLSDDKLLNSKSISWPHISTKQCLVKKQQSNYEATSITLMAGDKSMTLSANDILVEQPILTKENLSVLTNDPSKSLNVLEDHKLSKNINLQCDAISNSNHSTTVLKDDNLLNQVKFQCTHCINSFSSQRHLTDHLRKLHNFLLPIECKLCGWKMRTSKLLSKHLEKHKINKQYPCIVCNKSFYSQGFLREHSKIHSNVVLYPCTHCDKKYETEEALHRHRLSIENKKKIICSKSSSNATNDIKTNSSSKLNKIKNYDKKRFKHLCHDCGDKFQTYFSLLNHIQTFHILNQPLESNIIIPQKSSTHDLGQNSKKQHIQNKSLLCNDQFIKNISTDNLSLNTTKRVFKHNKSLVCQKDIKSINNLKHEIQSDYVKTNNNKTCAVENNHCIDKIQMLNNQMLLNVNNFSTLDQFDKKHLAQAHGNRSINEHIQSDKVQVVQALYGNTAVTVSSRPNKVQRVKTYNKDTPNLPNIVQTVQNINCELPISKNNQSNKMQPHNSEISDLVLNDSPSKILVLSNQTHINVNDFAISEQLIRKKTIPINNKKTSNTNFNQSNKVQAVKTHCKNSKFTISSLQKTVKNKNHIPTNNIAMSNQSNLIQTVQNLNDKTPLIKNNFTPSNQLNDVQVQGNKTCVTILNHSFEEVQMLRNQTHPNENNFATFNQKIKKETVQMHNDKIYNTDLNQSTDVKALCKKTSYSVPYQQEIVPTVLTFKNEYTPTINYEMANELNHVQSDKRYTDEILSSKNNCSTFNQILDSKAELAFDTFTVSSKLNHTVQTVSNKLEGNEGNSSVPDESNKVQSDKTQFVLNMHNIADDPNQTSTLLTSNMFQVEKRLKAGWVTFLSTDGDKEKNKMYNCHFCNKSFTSDYVLDKHVACMHVPFTHSIVCSLCDKTFLTHYMFQKHVDKKHLRLKQIDHFPKLKTCSNCDLSFSSTTYHDHPCLAAIYHCVLCRISFTKETLLTKHYHQIHMYNNKYICMNMFCSTLLFSNKEDLLKHKEEFHYE